MRGLQRGVDGAPGMTLEQCRVEYDRLRAISREEARQHVAAERAKARQRAVERNIRRADVPPRYRDRGFERYEASTRSQQRALRVCQHYAETFGSMREHGTNLLMLGNPRTGKTHLACAIVQAVAEQGYTGLFTCCDHVVTDFRDAHRRNEPELDVLNRYTGIDLLVLDEVGFGTGSQAHRQDRLFRLINERTDYLRPTILLGNVTEAELAEWLGERSYHRVMESAAPVLAFDWEAHEPRPYRSA